MAKYIDAKKLYEKLYDADAITIRGCEIFRGFPAADVVEVKHGEWIEYEEDLHGNKPLSCSYCDYLFARLYPRKYCPNCGADMRGVKNGRIHKSR